ncbi:MAG: hypothetical protein H6922_01705 [Pseudomonadaceae bacterium]|nr:hypothetical protein [Pseudomonadaceae bacterium]
MPYTFLLVCGVLSALAYTLMQLLFKHGRAYRGNPLALTAWLGLLAPVWGGLLWLGLHQKLLVLVASPAYFGWAALWAAMATVTMALIISLIQRLSLTELTAYRKAFAAGIAMLADVLWLHIAFEPLTLAAIALILLASVWLSTAPAGRGRQVGPKDLAVSLLLVFMLAAGLTGQLYVYQQALLLQPDVLSHVVFVKMLMAVFSLGFWLLPSVRKHGQPAGWPLMLAIIGCYVVASFTEGYALQGLPVTLVVVTSFVAAACFTSHDLVTRDLPATRRTLVALLAVFGGFALLALGG